jgi:phosphonate transport system substrate-binding protein
VHKADSAADRVELLSAPVPEGTRYEGLPVYFSDVVVRRDSRFEVFGDLRGSVWAYNEPRSHSGFNVVRAYLATRAEADGFFSGVVESGAHTTSVRWVLDGRVDGDAIDSTVLEWLITERPELERQIRILASLGPSPILPWVISARVPEDLRARLRDLFLDMERDNRGRSVLAQGRIARFVSARDSDYDPIRRMVHTADQVSFS